MQLSSLRKHYGPQQNRLNQLWHCPGSAPGHSFQQEARVLWNNVWTEAHRQVLMRCLIDEVVHSVLVPRPGECEREKWEALIRCCLKDVFDQALAAASLPFADDRGIARFFEAVVCSPEGVNGAARLETDAGRAALAALAANVDEAGNNPGTLTALLRELRTTYATELCLALCLQLLRIMSSKPLLKRMSAGGGLQNVVISYSPAAPPAQS